MLAVVREQAPIATALMIAGAGGSAMCADLGARRIRDEISAMEVMGVDPIQRLVMPRILAATVLAVLLDAVVSAAGILGGWFFGVTDPGRQLVSSFFASFNELSQPWDLWMALIKAACFGFLAGMVACYKGLYAKGGPKGVGDAVNQAVVITFVLLFFVNFVLTARLLQLRPPEVLTWHSDPTTSQPRPTDASVFTDDRAVPGPTRRRRRARAPPEIARPAPRWWPTPCARSSGCHPVGPGLRPARLLRPDPPAHAHGPAVPQGDRQPDLRHHHRRRRPGRRAAGCSSSSSP